MKTNMTQIKGERMDKNVYAAIQSQYATFSKVGKRIADHIIADPVHITSISIQQMAAELGLTERAVEGRLYRLRQSLRQQLGGELYD